MVPQALVVWSQAKVREDLQISLKMGGVKDGTGLITETPRLINKLINGYNV